MNFSFWLFWFLGASELFIMTVMVLFVHLSICDFVLFFNLRVEFFGKKNLNLKKKKSPPLDCLRVNLGHCLD